MSNEPKKPMLQDYPGGWDGITQYVVDTNAYVNRLEAEVERLQKAYDQLTGEKFSDRVHAALKSRAELSESEAVRLQSDLACCKAERLGADGLLQLLKESYGFYSLELDDVNKMIAIYMQTQEGEG